MWGKFTREGIVHQSYDVYQLNEWSCGMCEYTTTFNEYLLFSLSSSPDINPANVTIYPHETSDGYFRTIVTLLRGVTGLVVQVINANGSMQFKQHINRSGSIRSTTRLPRGNYTVNIYQEMKNGLRPIKIGIPLQCIMKEEIDNDNTSTTFNEPQKALQC